MRTPIRFIAVVVYLCVGCPLVARAQTPPCGVAVVLSSDGPKLDERFLAASPEVVKQDFLKALPSLGYVVRKDEGFHVEAIQEIQRVHGLRETSADTGSKSIDGGIISGPVSADIKESTQDGTTGSQLSVEFKTGLLGHKGSNAGPLAAETACLVKLFGANDPVKDPRGNPQEKAATQRGVTLPAGTPVKVLLFAPMYSKDYKKNNAAKPIQFMVAEDVVVDGAPVIRRGALATGHLTDFKSSGAYGRHATLAFTFDTATAVDGQQVPVAGADQEVAGGKSSERLKQTADVEWALGWMIKGADVLIRAGTGYDLQVSTASVIQAGSN